MGIRPVTLDQLTYFNRQLAALEAQPKPIQTDLRQNFSVTLDGKTETSTLGGWYSQAQVLRIQRAVQLSIQSPDWEEQWTYLEQQMCALAYSAGHPLPALLNFEQRRDRFSALIETYKRNQKIYPGGGGPLTEKDRAQVETACLRYPHFVETLLRRTEINPHRDRWMEKFVKFCLRGKMRVDVFVETPNEADGLAKRHFDKRIGTVDPDFVQFIRHQGMRVLAMRIDGTLRPIQGNHKNDVVPLSNRLNLEAPHSSLRISTIFDQFKKKTLSYGSLEVVHQRGVILWDAIEMGVPNLETGEMTLLDVDQPGWILRMPPIGVIETQDLQQLYPGQRVCEEGGYGLVIRASREKPTRELLNNHAFIELIVPNPQQPGQFFRYPIGFQPKQYPSTAYGQLNFLQNTEAAGVHGIDESGYLTNRQQTGVFLTLSHSEFESTLDYLRTQIRRGREGNLYFQMTGENCGFFVQELYDAVRGNNFYDPLRNQLQEIVGWDPEVVQEKMDRIKRGLDSKALEEVAVALSSRLSETDDREGMQLLLDSCLRALNQLLPSDVDPFEFPSIQAVYQKNSPEEARRILQESLENLICITVNSQQFYKVSILDAEINKPLLSHIYAFLHMIPWEALRVIVLRILMFVFFASWRGYDYIDRHGTPQVARSLTSPVASNAMINLPARLFEWGAEQRERLRIATQLLGGMTADPIPLDVGA